jgi:hypothetical protein
VAKVADALRAGRQRLARDPNAGSEHGSLNGVGGVAWPALFSGCEVEVLTLLETDSFPRCKSTHDGGGASTGGSSGDLSVGSSVGSSVG